MNVDFEGQLPQRLGKLPKMYRLADSLWKPKVLFVYLLQRYVGRQVVASSRRSTEDLHYADARRRKFCLEHPFASRVRLKNEDGPLLDACILDGGNRPWLVYLNASGELYEDLFGLAYRYFQDAELNVMLFNYRGCGRSEGPLSSLGVQIDIETVLQYLESAKGVSREKIVLVGRSFGGAVGALAAAAGGGSAICNDRSFGEMTVLVRQLFHGHFLEKIAPIFVRWSGWDFDTASAWQQIPRKNRWLVHHPEDVVIYGPAALISQVGEGERAILLHSRWALFEDSGDRLRLDPDDLDAFEHPHRVIDAHNQPLHWDEEAWQEQLDTISAFLDSC